MENENLTDEEKLARYERFKRKNNRKFWLWLLITILLVGLWIFFGFIR
ncbi:MAG: hypothetical protein ACTSWC_04015 [Promethearchaeota archaeon]